MSQIARPTLKFLKDLKSNNNKVWFESNREAYEAARADFIDFTASLIDGMQAFAPEFGSLDPKKCVFRIYRDVRFSKDKRPYKENFGANLGIGKGGTTAGFYVQIQPGGQSFAAAGAYMPEPAALASIRQEIDYNLKAFEAILKAPAFKRSFSGLDEIELLRNAPKGYQPDNPALPYLRHKSFVVSRTFADSAVLANDFRTQVVNTFKHAYPLVQFLNAAVE